MPPFLLREEGPSPSCLAVMYKQVISVPSVGQLLTSTECVSKPRRSCICRVREGGSGADQDVTRYFLPCSSIRRAVGICHRPVQSGLEVTLSACSLAMTSLHSSFGWEEPRDLRVSGFLCLADLDYYITCYQVYPTAPWARRDCFSAQVVGNLVLRNSHRFSGPPSTELRQHLCCFKEPLTSGRFQKKSPLKIRLLSGFYFIRDLFSFAGSLRNHWEEASRVLLCSCGPACCSPASLIMAPHDSSSWLVGLRLGGGELGDCRHCLRRKREKESKQPGLTLVVVG